MQVNYRLENNRNTCCYCLWGLSCLKLILWFFQTLKFTNLFSICVYLHVHIYVSLHVLSFRQDFVRILSQTLAMQYSSFKDLLDPEDLSLLWLQLQHRFWLPFIPSVQLPFREVVGLDKV